jgi:hypothetical protein
MDSWYNITRAERAEGQQTCVAMMVMEMPTFSARRVGITHRASHVPCLFTVNLLLLTVKAER